MISNRVGYSPTVRQAAPQRQNFKGNVLPHNVLAAESRAERNLTRTAYAAISVFVGTIGGAGGLLGNEAHMASVRLPKAQNAITRTVDTASAKRILANSDALRAYNMTRPLKDVALEIFTPEEKYLKLTQDSLAGKPVSPTATYSKEIAIGKEFHFKETAEKAAKLKAESDSLYKSIGQ